MINLNKKKKNHKLLHTIQIQLHTQSTEFFPLNLGQLIQSILSILISSFFHFYFERILIAPCIRILCSSNALHIHSRDHAKRIDFTFYVRFICLCSSEFCLDCDACVFCYCCLEFCETIFFLIVHFKTDHHKNQTTPPPPPLLRTVCD